MSIIREVSSRINSEPPSVEVLHFTRCDERFVRARCRVRVGAVVISNIAIVHPTLGRSFVAMPSRKVGEEWQPLVGILSPTLETEINDAVMAAWRDGGQR